MLVIEAGPPTKRNLLPVGIQAYFPVITDLTIVDDVVCLGDRLVIPSSLRQADPHVKRFAPNPKRTGKQLQRTSTNQNSKSSPQHSND